MELQSNGQVSIARTAREFEPYLGFVNAVHRHPAAAPEALAAHSGRTTGRLAVLERDGAPVALIAGQLSDIQQEWRLGYLKLGSTRARVLRVVTGGYLGDVEREDDAKLLCAGLLRYLSEGEADAVQLVGIRARSPLLRALVEGPGWFLRDRSVRTEPHWWSLLPGSYENFYRSRSPNTKGTIRQSANRITKRFGGAVEVRCYRQPDEVDRAMNDIERVGAKTYQRAINVGFLPNEELRQDWLHEARQGWLTAFVLYLDGQPRAFWTGAVYRGIFTSYTTGFDPEFGYYHPGIYLLARMIETFCSWRLSAVDFGSGDADYKRKFGTKNVEEASLVLFAPTLRGVRLSVANNALALANCLSRRILNERQRVQVKSLWRRFLLEAK